MIHLKNLHLDVHIHFLTIVYIIIACIGGYLVWYLSALIIVCIHELCHLMMAYYFQFDIDKIEILPFGAYLSINDFYFHPILNEICVVLAGPSSHLFMHYLINTCFQGKIQHDLLLLNGFVFFFNFIPVYPMDGHRLVSLLLQASIDLKNAMYLSLKLSVLSLAILSVCYLHVNTFIMIGYLLSQQFVFMKFIPQYLREYYSQIPSLYKREKIKIHESFIYRRGYHNYYLLNGQLYDEKSVMYEFIKNVKK